MRPADKPLSKERLNEIAWDVGHHYPPAPSAEHIALYMAHPRLGHVHWHINSDKAEAAKDCRFVIRVHDVTDIIFDGHNAHSSFDIEGRPLTGSHYFGIGKTARNYIAEAGMKCADGSFHPIARSGVVFFERESQSGNYSTKGLFIGNGIHLPLENIFDAPVFEELNNILSSAGKKRPRIATVLGEAEGVASLIAGRIEQYALVLNKFADVKIFKLSVKWDDSDILKQVKEDSADLFVDIKSKGFDLIHCHDWLAAPVRFTAKKGLNLPMVITLHSTEHCRTNGHVTSELSRDIHGLEERASDEAELIIAPSQATARTVIETLGVPEQRLAVIPFGHGEADTHNTFDARQVLGLSDGPVALFAGELSYESGADLFVDALPVVCRNHGTAQFIVAGDGGLRRELEGRIRGAGIGHRCRFTGDVSREAFESILHCSDFVVIPARTRRDEGLARLAIGLGKPVVTTHQAGLGCVTHGKNGLVTFDNTGSIVWGIQEMLHAQPLQAGMHRIAAQKKARDEPSVESIAALHMIHYLNILDNLRGKNV